MAQGEVEVSVIVPTYNEGKNIEVLVEKLAKVIEKSGWGAEVIVVDDSTDETIRILKKLEKKFEFLKVKHREKAKGIGSAIKEGIRLARGEIIVVMMGDLSDDPEDLPKLVEKVKEGYDIVCGSRFMKGSVLEGYPFLKKIAHRIYNKLFSMIFGLHLSDFTNEFKAYRRVVFEKIWPESDGFEIAAEIVLKAKRAGIRITEVPVSWRSREHGKSKLGSFSFDPKFLFFKLPKIGWSYGKVALKSLLSHHTYKPEYSCPSSNSPRSS